MANKEQLVTRCVCIAGIPGSVQNVEVVRTFLRNCSAPALDVLSVEGQPFEWVALLRDHQSARGLIMGGKRDILHGDQPFTVKVTPSNLCTIPDDWVNFEGDFQPSPMDTSPSGPAQDEYPHPQHPQPHLQHPQQQQQQEGGAAAFPGGPPPWAPGPGPYSGAHGYPTGFPGYSQGGQGHPPGQGFPPGVQGFPPGGQGGQTPQWPLGPWQQPQAAHPGVGAPGSLPQDLRQYPNMYLMFQHFMQQFPGHQQPSQPVSGPGNQMHEAHSSPELGAEGGQKPQPPHLGKSRTEPVLAPPESQQSLPRRYPSRGESEDSASDFTVLDNISETCSEMDVEPEEPERPAMLRIWDLPSTVSDDDIMFYFENRRKKGGGPIEKIELNMQRREAIITFQDADAVERVLQNAPHLLKDKAIKVERHDPAVAGALEEEEEGPEEEEEGEEKGSQRTLHITGIPTSVSEEMVELYLENKKKGGGAIEDHQYDTQKGTVIVTFESEDVAESFLNRKHTLGGKVLTVKLWVPPKPIPMYKDRLLLSGAKETTTLDCLTNFLEAKIDCEPKEFICGDEPGVYMVVFKENPDIGKLQEVCRKRPLEGATLTVSPVPVSCTVKVKNLKSTTTKDSLELYFESSKKSHGGEVGNVELLPDEGAGLVTFLEPEVALRVCAKKDHKLEGAKLEVCLHHECLGPGGGSSPDDFKLPAPVEQRNLDKYKLMYLRGTTDLLQALEKELQEAHVRVTWPKKKTGTTVRLECTLTPEVQGARKMLYSWGKNAQTIFQRYLEELIKMKKKEVLRSMWSMVEERLTSINSPDREAVTLFVEKDNASLIMAGMAGPVKAIYAEVEKLIQAIERQLEEEKTVIEETIDKLKPHQLQLLRAIKFPNMATSKYPGLQVQCTDRGINFKGQHKLVKSAQVEMYEKVSSAACQKLTHFSPSQLAMLKNREMKSYLVEKFRADQVVGVWDVQDKNLMIHACTDREAVTAADIVKKSLVEFKHELEQEAQDVLKFPEWRDLVKQLHGSSPGVLKVVEAADCSYVQITSNDQVCHAAKETIVNFLRENAIYTRKIAFPRGRQKFLQTHRKLDLENIVDVNKAYKVRIVWAEISTQFTVRGTKDGVQRAMERLKSLAASVCYMEVTLKRPGVQRLIESAKGKDMLDHVEKSCNCIISKEEEQEVDEEEDYEGVAVPKGIEILGVFSLPPSRKLYISYGDITEIRADVIVNAANGSLDHCGGLAKAIVDKGGYGIQEECTGYVKKVGQVPEGEVMVSGSGKLPCKILIHAVGPMWQGGHSREEQKLQEVIFRSLEEADKHQSASIAIPAISAGIFGYPPKYATRTIIQTVKEHFKNVTDSSIKDIFLCTIDRRISKHFIDAAQQVLEAKGDGQARKGGKGGGGGHYKSPIPESMPAAPHHGRKSRPTAAPDYSSSINISLVKGEIAQQTVDVIVNSTSKELNLTHGAVSKSILAAAGPAIQQECSQKYPKGVRGGEVATTGPGNLRCQTIFHTSIPQWKSGGDRLLGKQLKTVLQEASDSGYTSLALPAMGTGQLGYPRDLVAKCFFETISTFGKKNPSTSLTDVRIVLYQGDTATIKAFEAVQKGTAGLGSRRGRVIGAAGGATGGGVPGGDGVPSGGEGGFKVGNFQVVVKQGDITQERVDAIVNSTNDNLDLRRGAVSQTIWKASKGSLADECKAKADDMKQNKVATTSAPGLPCKHIVHISGEHFRDSWKKAVIKCLKEAETLKAKSIALPLLGTGAFNSTPEEMAVCFCDALVDFKPATDSCLSDVRIVIFQREMLTPFSVTLHDCLTKGKRKGFFSHVRGFLGWLAGKGDGPAEASGHTRSRESGPRVPVASELKLYVHAGDKQAIQDVRRRLEDACDKEIIRKMVTEDDLKMLEPTEVDHIVAVGVSNGVLVDRYDRSRGEVHLEGLPEDVMKTNDAIQKILRNRLRAEAERQQAEILSDLVQWKFVEVTTKGENRMDYDTATNALIEKAYRDQQPKVKFSAWVEGSSVEYEIDFRKMEEYPVKNKKDTVAVVRTDKVKGSKFEQPANWKDMTDDEDLVVVQLPPSSQEYQTVVNSFKATGHQVIKVERIQNKTLYMQYSAKRQQMESKQQGNQVEHVLWHGTASNAIFSINTYGFNRSYCGKNATAYGQGVYFAVNPSYSASNTYSVPDPSGQKHIYQARVLTGYVGPGNQSLRVPPARQGQELFDSVADNPGRPGMYIIFNDTQAYPEYLITFS